MKEFDKIYSHTFYSNRHTNSLYAANNILDIIFSEFNDIKSVVDFGCGVGTWLSVAKTKGAMNILGLDGNWVNKDLLEIPISDFRVSELKNAIKLNKKYDLAISLEVAEHIPESNADSLVNSLTNASDLILFSAAIPQQGGKLHVNEQWPEYWMKKFSQRGFKGIDMIRRLVWNDERLPVWYRQNIFIFINELTCIEKLEELKKQLTNDPILNVVHPELFLKRNNRLSSNKFLIKKLLTNLKNSFFNNLK